MRTSHQAHQVLREEQRKWKMVDKRRVPDLLSKKIQCWSSTNLDQVHIYFYLLSPIFANKCPRATKRHEHWSRVFWEQASSIFFIFRQTNFFFYQLLISVNFQKVRNIENMRVCMELKRINKSLWAQDRNFMMEQVMLSFPFLLLGSCATILSR